MGDYFQEEANIFLGAINNVYSIAKRKAIVNCISQMKDDVKLKNWYLVGESKVGVSRYANYYDRRLTKDHRICSDNFWQQW